MATACHLLQMLLQLLLLQQLLQGSLGLTVQVPSCSGLYWIAHLWHSLVLSLLIALLGRARLLLLRVHAASNVMSKGCGCKLLMVQRCQVLGQDHLLLQLLNQELVLVVLKKLHLLLILLLRSQLRLICFVFLNELAYRLYACQVNDIVFVTPVISSYVLVRSVSPVTIHSELVHDFLGIQELDEVVSRGRLTGDSQTLLSDSKSLQVILWFHLLHTFTLPTIEITHQLNNFTTKRPLEEMLNFRPKCILKVLRLYLRQRLLIH